MYGVLTIEISVFWQWNWTNNWRVMNIYLGTHETFSQFLLQDLWCDCSAFWWYIEFNLSHHSSYLCQRFSKGFVWCIILHHHRSKLNGIASMVISISQYQPLTKEIIYSPEICGNILNIFWGGIKTTQNPV